MSEPSRPTRTKKPNPYLGFGWVGWVGVVALAVLAILFWRRFDLVHFIQQNVANYLGNDALIRVSIYLHWSQVYLRTWRLSPLTCALLACAVLMVRPGDRSRVVPALLILVAGISTSVIQIELIGLIGRSLNLRDTLRSDLIYLTHDILTAVFVVWLVARVLRSLIVTVWTFVFSAAGIWARHSPDFNMPGVNIGAGPGLWESIRLIAWNALLVAPAFAVAFSSQLRAPPPEQACPHCEYDLAGLRDSTCPECGEDVSAVVASSTATGRSVEGQNV